MTLAEKQATHRAIYRAVKTGKLVKPINCPKCGDIERIQGHHPDYTKPLEVVWLCQPCHQRLHIDQGDYIKHIGEN